MSTDEQLIEWTDKDGVKHRITINGARELLHKFYDEWPGGWPEVEAEQRARAEAAPAVAQVPYNARRYLQDVLESGTVTEQIVARTALSLFAAPEAPAQEEQREVTQQEDAVLRRAAMKSAKVINSPAQRCPYCDDTGDVHTPTGEWRGRCTCPAGTEAPAQAAPSAGEVEREALNAAHRLYEWAFNEWEACKAECDRLRDQIAALSHKEQR